jgi:hypothetical protein
MTLIWSRSGEIGIDAALFGKGKRITRSDSRPPENVERRSNVFRLGRGQMDGTKEKEKLQAERVSKQTKHQRANNKENSFLFLPIATLTTKS